MSIKDVLESRVTNSNGRHGCAMEARTKSNIGRHDFVFTALVPKLKLLEKLLEDESDSGEA